MKQEKILNALGGLDDRYLAESEGAMERKPRRILWRTVCIAAVIVMLAAMAVAATIEYLDFGGVTLVQDHISASYTQRYKDNGDWDIRAEVDLNWNAEVLVTPYMIQAPEEWALSSWMTARTDAGELTQFHLAWILEEDDEAVTNEPGQPRYPEDYVKFLQQSSRYFSLSEDGTVKLATAFDLPEGVAPETHKIVLGDIPVLKVVIPPPEDRTEGYMEQGEIWLFWSDGNSVMTLTCPGWMTDGEIGDLLDTLYVPQDIEALLEEVGNG